MAIKRRPRNARQQRHLRKHLQGLARQVPVDSMIFFDLLTGPELFEPLEARLPQYRERRYPPTVTLAMFPGQELSAGRSCQNAVNQAMVSQLQGLGARRGEHRIVRQPFRRDVGGGPRIVWRKMVPIPAVASAEM